MPHCTGKHFLCLGGCADWSHTTADFGMQRWLLSALQSTYPRFMPDSRRLRASSRSIRRGCCEGNFWGNAIGGGLIGVSGTILR